MQYLTKSKFKLAVECLTKLYYTINKDYADESIEDPFLQAIAEGGFQVGELAKYLFCDDPVAEDITIDNADREKALGETNKRLKKESVVIAEAAFCYKSLFIRSDIIAKDGFTIDLYEVKSKSTKGDDIGFITKKGEPKIMSEWIPYLYDIAFQKYVITKSLKGKDIKIRTHIILVDKSKISTVDGLNQKFKIRKTSNGTKVEIETGLKKKAIGESILKIQNIDEVIDKILEELIVPSDYKNDMKFTEFLDLCIDLNSNNKRIYTPLGKKCKDCQFVNRDPKNNSQKSGFHECWINKTKYNESELRDKNLVLELWCGLIGSRPLIQELIDKGKYLLEQMSEQEIAPKTQSKDYDGLSPHQRRMEQITRVKNNKLDNYFDKEGLLKEAESWTYPLHMIDFETSMPALPFHKGRHPYEGIAFQFSHHIMEKNGEIRHAGQYLSFEPGVFPNYEFVRALKSQLETDKGTIFRYHNHENTYLNFIAKQLDEDRDTPKDRDALKEFIRAITSWKEDTSGKEKLKQGARCMIDLYKLVLYYYYSPLAKGSNSIKDILPAIIQESGFLKDKYSKPIYGKQKQIKSLNFDEHIWIDPKYDMDPYKTLPRLFKEYDTSQLDKFFGGLDELADGGAAMTAYNYLQYSYLTDKQREELKQGLLRYCELDTMAMVMILEGWLND